MAAKINLKSSGMAAMLKEGWIYGVLEPKAQAALARAKSSAPVASGGYRDSIRLERVTTDRNVVRVVADAPHAMIVEANTGNIARSL